MPRIARVPINNFYEGGDYTGRILVGPDRQPMNVILDTGSSALALDAHKYHRRPADTTTRLAQSESYADGSEWTGAVVNTSVTVGVGDTQVTVNDANVALAYEHSADMFAGCDGILGLAYAPLDDAHEMPGDSWTNKYSAAKVTSGKSRHIVPFLTQLDQEHIVFDRVSFFTRRSFVHHGGGGADDPLNQGWMIVGGGEESTDLYTGPFQTAKVLDDKWYSTHLKAVMVGASVIPVRAGAPQGSPTNSIVDSGTQTIDLDPQLLRAIIAQFSPDQQHLLKASILHDKPVHAADLDLSTWPDITFVLQSDGPDALLRVKPGDYWQINAPRVGAATAALSRGDPKDNILGLPLMNGYFTIFDGEADGGKGVIKFATSRRPGS